jgi:hypothetical protein
LKAEVMRHELLICQLFENQCNGQENQKGYIFRGDINQASLKPSAEAVYVCAYELLLCQLYDALPDLKNIFG